MHSSFRIPQFLLSVNAEPVEGKVLKALALQHPLTLEEITAFLEIEFNCSCDYSLVGRIVGELVAQGVLLKNKNTYSISVEWIQLLKEFANRLPDNIEAD